LLSMEDIKLSLKTLRVNLRKNASEISENVFERFHPAGINFGDEICVFCKSRSNLTKEHVIPRWVFQRNVGDKFVSSVNRQTQSYNKAVIPACTLCNSSI